MHLLKYMIFYWNNNIAVKQIAWYSICRDLSLSASGSILPPLPYTPEEGGAFGKKIPKKAKKPKGEDLKGKIHTIVFGIPGVDEGIFTYRGGYDAVVDVLDILHGGRFEVGYKVMTGRQMHADTPADSRSSLEILFSDRQSLQSIPEQYVFTDI